MTSVTESAMLAASARRPLTETERNWLWAVLILVAGVALFAVAKIIENKIGVPDEGAHLFGSPAGAYMRFIGIAHFLIALYFTLTSRSMKGARPWARFLALLTLGGLLCLGYHWIGTGSAFAASVAFFSYFLIHDARDQVFFYFHNGDGPESVDRRAFTRALVCVPFLIVSVLALLTGVAGLAAVPGLEPRVAAAARGRLPGDLQWLFVGLPLVVIVGLGLVMGAAAREGNLGSLRSRFRAHRPIYLVLSGTMVVFLVMALLGYGLYSIVILHVAAWYVFTTRQLQRQPASAARLFTGRWLRSTVAGFGTLHIGLAALLLGLGAAWAWGYGNSADVWPAWLLLDKGTFNYWTILHVTVSFRPR